MKGASRIARWGGDGPTLDSLATDRNNNFNLLRVTLAFAVIVHHAFVITGNAFVPESLLTRFLAQMGDIAVAGFFVISGFLVTRSLFLRATVAKFAMARILRIYPGLIVMLLVTTVLLAPFSSVPPIDYLANPQTWLYVARNATAIDINYDLPGLFKDHASSAVNGSLWSLRYEMLCYAMLALAGLLGFTRRSWPIGVATGACAIALLVLSHESLPYMVSVARKMGFLFGVGATAAAFAAHVPMRLRYVLALFLAALLLDPTPLSLIVWSIAFGYLLLWFAYVPKGAILGFNRLPDISYGLYIYAYPVQQLMIQLGIGADPASNILLATPVTALFATLSWYSIEKPALQLKNWLGRRKDPRADGSLARESA